MLSPTETITGLLLIHTFFDQPTSTWTYVVADPKSLAAYVIDPVLTFDPSTNLADPQSLVDLARFIESHDYLVQRIIETHVHADHLTGAATLKEELLRSDPPVYIGRKVAQVQQHFAPTYGFDEGDLKDSFDGYLDDGAEWRLGDLVVKAMSVPGHTPDSMAIVFPEAVFVGDSLLLPHLGTARCDFPGGDVEALWGSTRKLLQLGDEVRVFSAHDYPAGNSAPQSHASVQQHQDENVHVKHGTDQATFSTMRRNRDATLSEPRLLKQSLRVNLRGGRLSGPIRWKT